MALVRALILIAANVCAVGHVVGGSPVEDTIAREQSRTERIGDQTALVADELATILKELEMNRLLAGEESADFVAAREGMDEIAKREARAVLEQLVSARQVLERAKQAEHLKQTIAAQERLIVRLTVELVRIQYRSQLRHLLDQMRTIVGEQRQTIRGTQNGAIEMAASDSDSLRDEIHDRVIQAQDGVWHDWVLVREQVRVMTERFQMLPFMETLQQFRSKAESLPIESGLAQTREQLRQRRFGLAVSRQRELAGHFLLLLKILQEGGLSPAEQRSALEELIEKTEEALREQQDLLARTETFSKDMTGPLRDELARAEDQLAGFVKDLSREADQVLRQEAVAEAPTTRTLPSAPPAEATQPEKENPWADATKQKQPAEAQAPEPSTPAGRDLGSAANRMTGAADELTQSRTREATDAQREAANLLAQALARMRDQAEQAAQQDKLDELLDSFGQQGELLDEIGQLIRDQQNLMEQTQGTARDGAQAASPKSAELGQDQVKLGDRTQQLAQQLTLTGAALPLADAAGAMDRAATQLDRSQPRQALPHQSEALRSLREAERGLAQLLAEALGADEAQQWLGQIGELDRIVAEIERMAGQAEVMPPAPAPTMAGQAGDISQQLSDMVGAPPAGPAMAAQLRGGSQLMNSAGGQLNQGQTPQAAQTMHNAADMLTGVRADMAQQMAKGLSQAQAQAMAKGQAAAQAQAASAQQMAAAMAGQKAGQPSSQPSRGGQGKGMRGLGPTDYDANREVLLDLESGAWSRLPERERQEVLQGLRERFPARYERALIRYYRNLSRLEEER